MTRALIIALALLVSRADAVDLKARSVSSSKQFIVFCPDAAATVSSDPEGHRIDRKASASTMRGPSASIDKETPCRGSPSRR